MNKPRACWTVLLNKAEEAVSLIQADLTLARNRLQSLQASRERLQQLYNDYQKAPAEGSSSIGMQETMNQRQFAAQLLVLMQRVDQDIAQTERAMAQCRQRLAEAERERLKMQALVDQDLRNVQNNLRRREQRQMDDMGVMQFNLGTGA